MAKPWEIKTTLLVVRANVATEHINQFLDLDSVGCVRRFTQVGFEHLDRFLPVTPSLVNNAEIEERHGVCPTTQLVSGP